MIKMTNRRSHFLDNIDEIIEESRQSKQGYTRNQKIGAAAFGGAALAGGAYLGSKYFGNNNRKSKNEQRHRLDRASSFPDYDSSLEPHREVYNMVREEPLEVRYKSLAQLFNETEDNVVPFEVFQVMMDLREKYSDRTITFSEFEDEVLMFIKKEKEGFRERQDLCKKNKSKHRFNECIVECKIKACNIYVATGILKDEKIESIMDRCAVILSNYDVANHFIDNLDRGDMSLAGKHFNKSTLNREEKEILNEFKTKYMDDVERLRVSKRSSGNDRQVVEDYKKSLFYNVRRTLGSLFLWQQE